MSGRQAIDLTERQLLALRQALTPFAACIDLVGVYGSRVQGRARPGSDVDLVIYGPASPTDVADMRSALEESDLSIFADVTGYDRIEHAPLREQIDYWMQPLFAKHALLGDFADQDLLGSAIT